jgi:hypothetical protein
VIFRHAQRNSGRSSRRRSSVDFSSPTEADVDGALTTATFRTMLRKRSRLDGSERSLSRIAAMRSRVVQGAARRMETISSSVIGPIGMGDLCRGRLDASSFSCGLGGGLLMGDCLSLP